MQRRVSLCVIPGVLLALLVSAGSPAGAVPAERFYLALGDSLSIGAQPDASGQSVPTDHGYVDLLYTVYGGEIPSLRLAKLGCIGETTTTMVDGGVCYPPGDSQLDQAVEFLETHRVSLVTIDIGADNLLQCTTIVGVDIACVQAGIAAAARDLPVILGALRAAGGPSLRIVAMNYYDPFLAAWLLGPAGQALAVESVGFTVRFNDVLQSAYAAARVPVADVESAFRTTVFIPVGVPPVVDLPVNVFLTCQWTFSCTPPPIGPNPHPNDQGYGVIAATFVKTIGVLPGPRR